MSVKLLTEHHLEFLHLKGGFTVWSESTLVKMPHCWKSHVSAHIIPWARHIYPSLVLVQPRKTRPYITERLLVGRKESNQTKTVHIINVIWNNHVRPIYGEQIHVQNCTYRESTFLCIKLTKDTDTQILVIDYCVSRRLYVHVYMYIDINCSHDSAFYRE